MPHDAEEDGRRSSTTHPWQLKPGKRRRSRHRFETSVSAGSSRPSRVADVPAVLPRWLSEQESTPLSSTGTVIYSDAEQEPQARPCQLEAGFDNRLDMIADQAEFEYEYPTLAPNELDCVERPLTSKNSSPVTLNWKAIWGLLMTNGSVKMTKEQYQCMRLVADTFSRLSYAEFYGEREIARSECSRINCLPHYTTLFKTYRPLVFSLMAVRGHLFYSELNTRSAGARITRYSEQGAPLIPVLTVMPSDYAREDVACGPVFDLMRSTSLKFSPDERPNLTATDCVDCWPLVAGRDWFYGPCSSFSVDGLLPPLDTYFFAETGDTVQITVLGANNLENAVPFLLDPMTTTMKAKILHIWTVHHQSRRNDVQFLPTYPTSLSSLDKNIVEQFSFTSYTSPSDSVQAELPEIMHEEETGDCGDIAALPHSSRRTENTAMTDAMRRRRAALREQRCRTDRAWRCWKKPLLKPGDTVSLFEPVSFSPNGECEQRTTIRLCLVHRFWIEQEERGRHVFLVAKDANGFQQVKSIPFHSTDDHFHRDVRQVELASTANSVRGPYRATPVSSIGTLHSGESYFIYRFILYWDGFELASGKGASGDGIYLIPLNLPVRARSSPDAVRVISLTPPGVKAECVFKMITDDIVKGMTAGFTDYDADGNQIRIFLDLVAFIGDTPAINAVLDVLGHTGSACCHLCRLVRRSETSVGSRYALEGYHSFSSHARRSYYQHTALRDSGAKSETLRLLGLKPTDSEKYYPLHELRSRMVAARGSIPKTSDGIPLISGYLDPYRSCLIAPDHLLTGHFRDCLNCAFGLLPTPEHRKIIENLLISLLSDCNLSVQNRLYDHAKRGLFSMSMTEIYSLSVVAEFGFVKGCAIAIESESTASEIPDKCFDAIRLLGSCARLITELWYLPDCESDAVLAESTATSNNGVERLHYLQILVKSHIASVKSMCHMADEKVHMLQSARTSKQAKAELSKEYRLCQLAIKALDKPNLHRLQELVYGTLPLIGNISRIGELQLEKKHQVLKRAVHQSNHKNAHLQSMQSAIFTDWQGRLTLQVPGALQRNPKSEFGVYRLLAGRDEIDRIQGSLNFSERQLIHNALGPVSCVPATLSSQSKTVLSPRSQANSTLTWTLRSRKEIVTTSTESISSSARANAFQHFKAVCNLIDLTAEVEFAESIVCTSSNGFKMLTVKCGDVIEDRCLFHADLDRHYPIVNQLFGAKRAGSQLFHSVPLLWGVSCVFSFNGEQWAAVSLCRVMSDVPRQFETMSHSDRFLMDDKISFLRLHPTILPTGVIHDCARGSCAVSTTNMTVTHSISCDPFNGNPFFIKTRSDGFPPRRG